MTHRGALMLVSLALLMAPTAGDIGGCGQEVEELDAVKFYDEKEQIDCTACITCDFDTESCLRACSAALEVSEFERGCFPLVHDGEVCLNALRAADCDEYRPYVDDFAPETPTECNFCPVDQKPEGS